MMSGDHHGAVGGGGDYGKLESGASSQGTAATQLGLIDAMWECQLLVARSSCFRENSSVHFLCEIALFLKVEANSIKTLCWSNKVHLQDEFGLWASSMQLLLLVQTPCLIDEETEIQRS